MMQQRYKLLVLDLDGTLTNDQKEVTPRTLDALMKAQECGVRVVLCSGRPVYGISHLAEQLQLARYGGFVIAFNGGKVMEWGSEKVIMEQKLPDELVPLIYNAAVEAGFAMLTYRGKTIVTNRSFDRHVMHNAYINRLPIVELKDFLNEIEYPVNKCLIVGEPDALASFEPTMQQRFGDTMGVFRSQPFFLECVPPGIDKAVSLDVLCRHVGIDRSEVIAVGDAWNDMTMIEFAGLGCAMANAQQPVLDIADYITEADNNHDGVAEIIHRFIL